MWLNTTDKGKKLRDQFIEHAENVYDEVKNKVQNSETYQELSDQEFKQKIREVADKYADKKGLSDMTRRMIVRLINNHLDSIKAEIKTEEPGSDSQED